LRPRRVDIGAPTPVSKTSAIRQRTRSVTPEPRRGRLWRGGAEASVKRLGASCLPAPIGANSRTAKAVSPKPPFRTAAILSRKSMPATRAAKAARRARVASPRRVLIPAAVGLSADVCGPFVHQFGRPTFLRRAAPTAIAPNCSDRFVLFRQIAESPPRWPLKRYIMANRTADDGAQSAGVAWSRRFPPASRRDNSQLPCRPSRPWTPVTAPS